MLAPRYWKFLVRSLQLLFASLVLLLAGCSAAIPSPSVGKTFLQEKIAKESEGRLQLARFSKTDGQKIEMMGMSMYSMKFEAELVAQEDCKWLTNPMGQSGFGTMKPTPRPAGNGFSWDSFMGSAAGGVAAKSGQHIKFTGEMSFNKSEKGWQVSDWRLTSAQAVGEATPPATSPAVVPVVNAAVAAPAAASRSNPFPDFNDEIADLQARLAKPSRTSLDGCIINLRNIHLAARVFSKDSPDLAFPHDFVSTSNELSTTKVVTCPDDRSVVPAKSFDTLTAKNVSYVLVSPGIDPDKTDPRAVYVKCPIHHYVCRVDGTIEKE